MNWIKKVCATQNGQFAVGLLFAIAGFFFGMVEQCEHNRNMIEVLGGFDQNALLDIEQVKSLFSNLNAPSLLDGFAFAMLTFIFSTWITERLFPIVPHTSQTSIAMNGDEKNIIVNLLKHLAEQVFSRCSNKSSQCKNCSKFAAESDGLIRRYLYEECGHLQASISNSEKGWYELDYNIPVFHTIAIDHLLDKNSSQYSVVQYIGSKQYTEDNKYDETYNSLDYDFLYTLLNKVISRSGPTEKSYYQKDLKGKKNVKFKIKWLLIGDIKCMKNNYDYIFFVIKSLNIGSPPIDVVKEFFEFYIIDEDSYKMESDYKIKEYNNCTTIFDLSNEPSFGIFGDTFMFVDPMDAKDHGTIYTKEYKPQNKEIGLLEASIDFFEYIISKSEQKSLEELNEKYSRMCQEDPSWEKKLRTTWNRRRDAI